MDIDLDDGQKDRRALATTGVLGRIAIAVVATISLATGCVARQAHAPAEYSVRSERPPAPYKEVITDNPCDGGSRDQTAPGAGASAPVPVTQMSSPEVPQFAWPPPEASARVVLPPQLIQDGYPFRTLDDANAALLASLRQTGYLESSYYAIPDGFVLVTKIERIERNGTPRYRDRFSFSFTPSSAGPGSVREYLRALFTADPGYYRIIAFAVTDVPFTESEKKVTPVEAEHWIPRGTQALPAEIGTQPWTPRFTCTALIYEFIREEDTAPGILLAGDGALDALFHLRGAKLWRSRLSTVFGLPY